MKKALLACFILVLTTSCEQQKKPTIDTSSTTAEKMEKHPTERDLMVQDSINQCLEGIAVQLWGENNWGETLVQQLKWQEKCRQRLICCFDSIHPGNQLSETEKEDSLLSELDTHFDGEWASTTVEMNDNNWHWYGYMMYKTLGLERQILDIDSSWKHEIEAWYRFQKQYRSFVFGLDHVWWGDSPRGPLFGAATLSQMEDRYKDISSVLYCLQGKVKTKKAVDLDSAVSKFTKTAESEYQSYLKDGEDIMLNQVGVAQSEWDRLRKEEQEVMKKMHKELAKWCKVRKTLPSQPSAVKMIEEITVEMQYIEDY